MSLNSICIHREALVFNNYLSQVIILSWKLQLLVNLKYIFYLSKAIEQILMENRSRNTESKECWHQRFVKSNLFPTILSSVMKGVVWWMKGEQQISFSLASARHSALSPLPSSQQSYGWVGVKGNDQQFKVQMVAS